MSLNLIELDGTCTLELSGRSMPNIAINQQSFLKSTLALLSMAWTKTRQTSPTLSPTPRHWQGATGWRLMWQAFELMATALWCWLIVVNFHTIQTLPSRLCCNCFIFRRYKLCNWQLSALINAMQDKLPPTLYVQMDNTCRDNKNKYMLTFAALLVELGLFRKVNDPI